MMPLFWLVLMLLLLLLLLLLLPPPLSVRLKCLQVKGCCCPVMFCALGWVGGRT